MMRKSHYRRCPYGTKVQLSFFGDVFFKFVPLCFPALRGGGEDSFSTSSLSLSGLGDSMWNVWRMEIEGEFEDLLKLELMSASLCMILKDGRFVTLPYHDRVTHLGRGVEAVTLRDRNKEALILHEQFKLSKEETPHL